MKKLMLFLLAMSVAAGALDARELKPRIVFEKYLFAEGVNPQARDLTQLMVKFFDEDMIRLRNGELTSIAGKNVLTYTKDFLARHPEIRVEVIITSQTEEEYAAMIRRNEEMSGWDLVDLFSFYNFRLLAPAADPKALLADILKAPEVEIAYYESISLPATCTDLGSVTPDYRAQQTYHDPAPLGVNLDYANAQFGLEVCDGVTSTETGVIETGGSNRAGFETDHEDFTTVINATPERTFDTTRFHGTAVAGIVGACDENSVGVVGFTADHGLRWYDINSLASHADVYNRANSQLLAGEYTTNSWGYFSDPMPPGQTCTCNPGQNGMVPPEYVPSVKAAIQNGVAGGIFYFLSAGNGCTNLDHSTYGTTFRWSTDTGSMYVGAVEPNATHNASCFTNFGERVTLNAWGDGIVTTGYGDLRTGMGRHEYYAGSFGGTSGAGPIVAGCAGVMNNVYRSINSGANIAPSTMRSWLDDRGTAPGTTPGNIGMQPNLFGIMAPELNPDIRTGWYSYIVPRNTNDATGSAADLPATLNSNPSNTYWNSSIENTSYFATADPAYWRLYRDDVYIVWAGGGTLAPQGRTFHTNTQGAVANVRGGRHTTRITCDPLFEVVEQDEDNNSYTRQFVWNPYNLTSGAAELFSRPPTRLVTDQPGTYYNCDGYKGQTSFGGWWDIMACMASTSTADYDARVYSEAITSTNGFDDYEAWSGYVGPVDFVGVNENVLGYGTQLFGSVINWDDENASYIVEAQTSIGVGTPGVGRNLVATGSIATGEIFENYEFYVPVNADSNMTYTIEVALTSGNADVAISVFGPDDGYFSASNRNFFRNSTGNGGDEILHFVPGRSRWFGVVVHKYDHNSWNQSANFNLYIGKAQPDLTHTLRDGWSHKLAVRQELASEPIVLPPTLTGNASTNRFYGGYINQGGANTITGINNRFYLDGPSVLTSGPWVSTYAPGQSAWLRVGPVFVFGGRHNVGDSIDVNLSMPEWLENNNRHDEQFVWTPWALSNQSPVLTAQPGPNWRNSQSSVLFSPWNQDGYRFTGSSRWSGVAMAPTDPDDYYVMGLYSPSTGSENGFDVRHVPSFHGTGLIGFVMENGSINGAASFDVGVTNNWAWPGTVSEGAYRVYQCNSIQDLVNNAVNGPFTMASNHPMHVFDMQMTSGVPVRFILDNLGANDIGLAIFDANDVYGSRSQNGTVINANGDGADETIDFTPTSTGRHGVVVFKHNSTDLGSNQYRLIVGQRTPAVPQRMVLQVMNSAVNPIQMRAHWDSVTVDNSGAPLNVDHYQLYYTFTTTNPPFPGGWTPYITTPLATANFNVINTVEYFLMVVIAVDNDGYVVGHSPLPDGSNVAGMRIDPVSVQLPQGSEWIIGETPPGATPDLMRE